MKILELSFIPLSSLFLPISKMSVQLLLTFPGSGYSPPPLVLPKFLSVFAASAVFFLCSFQSFSPHNSQSDFFFFLNSFIPGPLGLHCCTKLSQLYAVGELFSGYGVQYILCCETIHLPGMGQQAVAQGSERKAWQLWCVAPEAHLRPAGSSHTRDETGISRIARQRFLTINQGTPSDFKKGVNRVIPLSCFKLSNNSHWDKSVNTRRLSFVLRDSMIWSYPHPSLRVSAKLTFFVCTVSSHHRAFAPASFATQMLWPALSHHFTSRSNVISSKKMLCLCKEHHPHPLYLCFTGLIIFIIYIILSYILTYLCV